MEHKYFECFSKKLFKYLVTNDFVPIKQREDLKNPSMYVWIFINCKEIQDAFRRFSNEVRK